LFLDDAVTTPDQTRQILLAGWCGQHPRLLPALDIAALSQKLQLSALTAGKPTAGKAANREMIEPLGFFQLIQTPIGSPYEMAKYVFLE
jgi:hypothetical protein